MISESKIRNFLVLCKELNFSKAAERLYLSQQALSAQIASLETDLQIRLFSRSTTRVDITPAGKELYQLFTETEARLAEIKARYQDEAKTKIRVLCFEDTDLGRELFAVRESLAAKNSSLQIKLQLGTDFEAILNDLDRDLVDLVITPKAIIPSRRKYYVQPLCEEPYYLFLSTRFPGAHPDIKLHELDGATFFISDKAIRWKEIISKRCRDVGFTPRFEGKLEPNMERLMVETGNGVGGGGRFSVLYRNKDLIRIPVGSGSALMAVWRRDGDRQLIHDYVDALVKEMQQALTRMLV